jgi:hypothetical protein
MRKLTNRIRRWLVRFLLKYMQNRFNYYEINFENKNDVRSKAIVFGHNLYIRKENFGSDTGVEITLPNTTYEHLLYESQLQNNAKLIRVVGENHKVIYKTLFYNQHIACGLFRQKPYYLEFYYSPFQAQDSIVDIQDEFIINGNTYIEIQLEPKEKLSLIIAEKQTKYRVNERDF